MSFMCKIGFKSYIIFFFFVIKFTIFFLIVFTVPPKIINLSRDIVVNEGSNVTLMCQASGKPEPSISWKLISSSGNLFVVFVCSISYTFLTFPHIVSHFLSFTPNFLHPPSHSFFPLFHPVFITSSLTLFDPWRISHFNYCTTLPVSRSSLRHNCSQQNKLTLLLLD